MNELTQYLHLVPPTDIHIALFILELAALGLMVGILSGLFGAGGGFLITPILSNLLGVEYALSIGSGLCFIVGTSGAGVARHCRMGNVEPKIILLIASGSMVGTIAGDWLQDWLKFQISGGDAQSFTNIMNGLYFVILTLTASLVWRGPSKRATGKPPLQRLPIGPHINLKEAGLTNISLPGLIVVGLGVGILTGLLGVGGGVLFMPILMLVVGLDTHRAVGTSLGVVLLSSLVGTAIKGWAGDVSLTIAASLLITSTTGVQIGAWICQKLHADRLRRYFALVVIGTALMVLYKLITGLQTPVR